MRLEKQYFPYHKKIRFFPLMNKGKHQNKKNVLTNMQNIAGLFPIFIIFNFTIRYCLNRNFKINLVTEIQSLFLTTEIICKFVWDNKESMFLNKEHYFIKTLM